MTELSSISAAPGVASIPFRLASEASPGPAPSGVRASATAEGRVREPESEPGPRPGQALQDAALTAARAIHAEKEVQVSTYFDEQTGRQIYRIADRASGEVLSQSPPEELLRLYAAIRDDLDRPLVAVEA